MRINIYGEELTDEVELVEKHIEDTGNDYVGVRFFLKSAPELHSDEEDDDRSAVTFWIEKSKKDQLLLLLGDAYVELGNELIQEKS